MDVWVGLDFGNRIDYSAVSVLSRSLSIDDAGLPRRNSKGRPLYDWQVRSLLRFDLRTPYPVICEKVARIATMRQWGPHVRVCCDATGVGVATSEMMRTALSHAPEIEVWGCSITSGDTYKVVGRGLLNVAKTQLMGAFAEVVDSGRFQVCRRPDGQPIRGTEVLLKELRAFKIRQSKSGNETSGAEGRDHDDLCLSCAIPVFMGGLNFMEMRTATAEESADWLPPREATALEAERAEREHAEQAALKREQAELEKANERAYQESRYQTWYCPATEADRKALDNMEFIDQ
jgi:hypothetical protein